MSDFAKRHYEAIAEILHRQKPLPHWSPNKRTQWNLIQRDFVHLFKRDNPHFHEHYFTEACENGLKTAEGGYRKRANAPTERSKVQRLMMADQIARDKKAGFGTPRKAGQ